MSDLTFTEAEYINPKGLLRLDIAKAPATDKFFEGKAYKKGDPKQWQRDDGTTYTQTSISVRFVVGDVLDKPANREKFAGKVVTGFFDLEMKKDNNTRKLAKSLLGAKYDPATARQDLAKALLDGKGSIVAMVVDNPKPDGRVFPKILIDTMQPVDGE